MSYFNESLTELFKTDRTLYILDTKDLYYIDNIEMFEFMRSYNVPFLQIFHCAITVVNCRLRNVEPSLNQVIDSIGLYKSDFDDSVSYDALRIVAGKCIGVALDILEPHFRHLYGTHHDPSTLLCIRGMKHSTLLLGLYRVNSMAFAL